MIAYSKKLIWIAEAWDGERADNVRVDLLRLFQQPGPVDGMFCREIYTILLDLKAEPEMLFSKMKRGTRYEINRAGAKDNLSYEYLNASRPEMLGEFCDYYDEFAVPKGQPASNRQWLALMAETGNLIVSQIKGTTGETLVRHIYYRSGGRATLLHSASLFRQSNSSAYRNMVGRANRFQHWLDILRFKAAGDLLYDFGGWYQGNEDQQRLSINKFKEEFGGEIVKNYICERGMTIKGKLFLRLRQSLLGNAI